MSGTGQSCFGSCLEPFLAGCYAPDRAGTCTQAGGVVSWSDGSKYDLTGTMPGLYGAGDATPCITIVVDANVVTATKGTEVLTYAINPTTKVNTVTCPDKTTLTLSNDQITHFNECVGINCSPE